MNPGSYTNFGLNDKNEILELNRMWIDDELGHNAESILISNSFKIIKKKKKCHMLNLYNHLQTED